MTLKFTSYNSNLGALKVTYLKVHKITDLKVLLRGNYLPQGLFTLNYLALKSLKF